MLYRTDACKGVGVECGRKDGGSKKSTAVRMDVQSDQASHVASSGSDRLIGTHTAGTQAPPVDTKLRAADHGSATSPAGAEGNADRQPIPKRGRPRTGFDKKAYDRKKSAERRARLKDGK
jgi:hypothetical protein